MSKSKSHIQINGDDSSSLVITCGDPQRAEWISTFLENAKPIAKNREYHSYKGEHLGTSVLVISHGVGAAGASICFKELIDSGAKAILRVGSAGGLWESCSIGDIVVATGAVRLEGASKLMLPIEYPAVPDWDLTQGLMNQLQPDKIKKGVVVSTDLFYASVLPDPLPLMQKCGAVAVEMEGSALFALGQIHGIATAMACVVDGNPLKWNEGFYDPKSSAIKTSFELLISAALRALIQFKA